MAPTMPLLFSLLPHPKTPAPMVRSIEGKVAFGPNDELVFSYTLWGDIARLRLPSERGVERADALWEQSCFEAFIGVQGDAAYHEFNFSPAGQWACYALSNYRQRDADPAITRAPRIEARAFAGRLELTAYVHRQNLPPNPAQKAWEIGVSAVVESADTQDGQHSYWALLHPSATPDFHQRAAFTLILAPEN